MIARNSNYLTMLMPDMTTVTKKNTTSMKVIPMRVTVLNRSA